MPKDFIELTQDNIDQLPDYTGVYKIYAYHKNEDKPVIIRRFSKDDISGLVYIGRTHKQSLRERLKNFEISLRKERTRNHTAAIKLWKRDRLKDLKQSRFFVCCSNPLDQNNAKNTEDNEIKKYIQDYGESPLLNG